VITRSLSASPSPGDTAAAPCALRVPVDAARGAGEETPSLTAARTPAATPSEDAVERLEELERLQALVVSTTAHELRTPLTVLRVHADLLIGGATDLSTDERASLEAISLAVARLQDVSDHLVAELRETAGGAEESLRRWLQLEQGSRRTRPTPA